MVTIAVAPGYSDEEYKQTVTSGELDRFITFADRINAREIILKNPIYVINGDQKHLFNGSMSTSYKKMFFNLKVDTEKLNTLLCSFERDIAAGNVTYEEIRETIEQDIKEFVTVEMVKNE